MHKALALSAALTLAALLSGCGLNRPGVAPVVIDPSCPVMVQRVVGQAAREWHEAIPETQRTIVVREAAKNVRCMGGPPPPMVDRAGNKYVVVANSFPGNMRIWPLGASEAHLRRALRHEFGHFLGAWGHPADGQALQFGKPSEWSCINRADIDAVCAERRCRGELRPNCK